MYLSIATNTMCCRSKYWIHTVYLLHDYTEKVDWTDLELENPLKLSRPGLPTLFQKKHLIKAHQFVASGLQGICSHFLKIFLENVFLSSTALYNIMTSRAKRYNGNNAYLTLKEINIRKQKKTICRQWMPIWYEGQGHLTCPAWPICRGRTRQPWCACLGKKLFANRSICVQMTLDVHWYACVDDKAQTCWTARIDCCLVIGAEIWRIPSILRGVTFGHIHIQDPACLERKILIFLWRKPPLQSSVRPEI